MVAIGIRLSAGEGKQCDNLSCLSAITSPADLHAFLLASAGAAVVAVLAAVVMVVMVVAAAAVAVAMVAVVATVRIGR